MSDKSIGDKQIELEDIYFFLEAYLQVTGKTLSLVACSESPDFICERQTGQRLGVELTRVRRERDTFWEKTLDKKEEIDPYEALDCIHSQMEKKEKLRASHYIKQVKENILVLQLTDGSLDSFVSLLENLKSEFTYHGFVEVWLADYCKLEMYSGIDLFCLYPSRWWGYHKGAYSSSKLYG